MQDFEKHEEERSDFLQEKCLHYIDACVVMQESIAEVSVMLENSFTILSYMSD